jgi:tetratricopeptide (TPR) repeat protein
MIAGLAYRYLVEHKGISIKEMYVNLIKNALSAARFGDWKGELGLCTSILTRLRCRDLRRKCYRVVLEMDSLEPNHWQTWALMESQEGNAAFARKLFIKGIRVDEKHASSWQAWGLMEDRQGNVDKARELFKKGLEADPSHAPSLQAWGLMEDRQGNVDKARELFKKIEIVSIVPTPSLGNLIPAIEANGENSLSTPSIPRHSDKAATQTTGKLSIQERAQKKSAVEELKKYSTISNEELLEIEANGENSLSTPSIPRHSDKAATQTTGKLSIQERAQKKSAVEELKKYSTISNEELLEEIRYHMDQLQPKPNPKIACPRDTLCVSGKCTYRI